MRAIEVKLRVLGLNIGGVHLSQVQCQDGGGYCTNDRTLLFLVMDTQAIEGELRY